MDLARLRAAPAAVIQRISRTSDPASGTPTIADVVAEAQRHRPSVNVGLLERAHDLAVTAHEALGLRDLSRSDLIIDDDGEVWFLEVNVAPGLTETSTVPLAVQAAGLDLGALVADLVRLALAR